MFGLGIKNELLDLVQWMRCLTHYTTLITIELETAKRGKYLFKSMAPACCPPCFISSSSQWQELDGIAERWRMKVVPVVLHQVLCSTSLYTSNSNSQIPVWLPNDSEEPKEASKVPSEYLIFFLTSFEISKLNSRQVCGKIGWKQVDEICCWLVSYGEEGFMRKWIEAVENEKAEMWGGRQILIK